MILLGNRHYVVAMKIKYIKDSISLEDCFSDNLSSKKHWTFVGYYDVHSVCSKL